ncbi:DEAD/DEAH box helicase [bacterium]|nr:DEAD/DEAH box helicase [bacterium]
MTDTTNPGRAVTFEDLGVADDLLAALSKAGISDPFPIQQLAIPDALAGRDVCGKAQTGSGKTLAFGIPMVERTGPAKPRRPGALVLVPTRELCAQVTEAIDLLVNVRGQRVVAIYGGVSMSNQIDALNDGAEVVVATPGRLLDLVDRGKLDLEDVKTVVVDEADQMADMGFLPQVHAVMRQIPRGHQTMLFSATLDGAVGALINSYLTDPVRHEVADSDDVIDLMEHRFLQVHYMDKAKVVATIIRNAGKVLVFVGTKRNADRVSDDLRKEGIDATAIHGDRRQEAREKALSRFASGKLDALVATNVAARGLHIDDVAVVIHYDPPQDYKSFVHRSGRTARAGEAGLVVTLVEWDQVEEVQRLQRAAGLHYGIVKVFSNDERLADLYALEPETVDMKMGTAVELSKRGLPRKRKR